LRDEGFTIVIGNNIILYQKKFLFALGAKETVYAIR
jgi:hypothetical protein